MLDIGAGPGSLVSSILDAAPAARVVALDASIEMLRAAAAHQCLRHQRRVLALPIGDATVDAVLSAFVLFHLSDPSCAVAQVARVLRTGGRVGTVTWAREATTKASAAWDEAFADAGVPHCRHGVLIPAWTAPTPWARCSRPGACNRTGSGWQGSRTGGSHPRTGGW